MKFFIKKSFDIGSSLIALILLSPLLLLLSIIIYFNMGSPVIFKHQRPGFKGNLFLMYKFRTMTDEKDEHGELLPDHIRLTKLGRFLRSTSLDELPELINVLKGDMSLVGPRPLEVVYLEHYSPEQMRRHDVKPGITGWAQVNGRNELSWENRFKLDVWYVDNHNFFIDLKIILITILKVVKREGVLVEGASSGEAFYGNLKKEEHV
ncbi:sugar transferase [Planomicrobium sp. CPCC 101079]|uniref:sugar transferase n=1 Tax=Planomicrobium sp. CPCC 101079 TaxID=2599618 RepID=UPI0011B7A516|nr:sugar transferase [Planomicrobium sp. CPCC 101079]TWT03727.1 sugar transferase [Planomicrobium sp. CPCC 101079]